MSTRDDIAPLYDYSKSWNRFQRILYIGNIVLVCLTFIWDDAETNIICPILFIADTIGFVSIDCLNTCWFWYEAERKRCAENIQNAFGISLLEQKTEGYYNNKQNPSILKWGMNNFESSFFTNNIAKKMILKNILQPITALILSVCMGIFLHDKLNILVFIAQTVFSTYILGRTCSLCAFSIKLHTLYENMYRSLISAHIPSKELVPLLIQYSVEYESLKAYYKIRLSSKIFNKYNGQLSKRWEEIADEASRRYVQ